MMLFYFICTKDWPHLVMIWKRMAMMDKHPSKMAILTRMASKASKQIKGQLMKKHSMAYTTM